MIEKWINKIKRFENFSDKTFKKEVEFIFEGDGEGDFAKYADKAKEKTVRKYIEYCENQIKWANEILKKKKHII